MFHKPIELSCVVKPYAWGKTHSKSIISKLAQVASQGKSHCAEFWMGAHPSGPAVCDIDGKSCSLDILIKAHPAEILGEKVAAQFGSQLPFLFKVLSIAQPLSIQAHPDKKLALELHAKNPAWYPDANHKPEMAVAISKAELLYGFCSFSELRQNINQTPEFKCLLSASLLARIEKNILSESEVLKDVYSSILLAPKELIQSASLQLYKRLSQKKTGLTSAEEWILKLRSNFPDGDVGLFSFFIHNIEVLQPGEAIFIGANIAHAYLDGELIECMANSDNVVRAGLTAKPKDVDTLLSMLNYSVGSLSRLTQKEIPDAGIRYLTPSEEFALERYSGIGTIANFDSGAVQLVFCLSGSGALRWQGHACFLQPGRVFLLPAVCPQVSLESKGGEFFRVYVPSGS